MRSDERPATSSPTAQRPTAGRPDRERDELLLRVHDAGNRLQVAEANLAAFDRAMSRKGAEATANRSLS
jgi:hypothetical protein